MSYKSILVNLDIDGPVIPVVKAATDLAGRLGARLIGFCAADAPMPIAGPESGALAAEAWMQMREDVESRFKEMHEKFGRLVAGTVETEWREGRAPIEAVEGFIRQVIGWREYVRGIYWLTMPDLSKANQLGATRPLPEFWWTGETDMACVADCVRATHKNAYAHHIQRLMVMGNFALLAGLSPQDVADWFLVVYADAFEWVELPNVAGMALFADGGKLASKPYAASGAYIDRMSNYCGDCRYDVKRKVGEGACPFNALYWDFLARNEERLAGNPRLANPYATWRRMSADKQAEYRDSAAAFLETLEPAKKGWARA